MLKVIVLILGVYQAGPHPEVSNDDHGLKYEHPHVINYPKPYILVPPDAMTYEQCKKSFEREPRFQCLSMSEEGFNQYLDKNKDQIVENM